MQKSAKRAAERLADPEDSDLHEYFAFLFTLPDDPEIDAKMRQVGRRLRQASRISPVPYQERRRANYRFYCDNDPVDTSINSTARWKIKDDPPGSLPEYYTPQRQRRARTDPDRPQNEPWQELQDDDNAILASGDDLCGYESPGETAGAITMPVDDQPSPLNPGHLAYGWYSARWLDFDKKIRNPDNYVFFGLLARLADLGFRMVDEWHGILERQTANLHMLAPKASCLMMANVYTRKITGRAEREKGKRNEDAIPNGMQPST
ncbi:MAG: hypothetical protein Q9227_004692 [Pyrenula ochraceoflavens]